ncbi:hypothetical protein LCGC14_0727260 [marine sediment metagenome]|uniref:Uncharacterized protein n=1 Tax=marine sediment metagenome TaxID=412755 RepID=A0A0F9THS7_9ZZZZ
MFSTLLVHSADTERLAGPPDRFGQPGETFVALATNIICRLSTASKRSETSSPVTHEVLQADFVLYTFPDVDLQQTDRIREVRDKDGKVLAELLEVVAVKRILDGDGSAHHLEVMLIEVRSDGPAS